MLKNKRLIAKCLVLFLLVSAFVLPNQVTGVQAAADKAVRIAFSFNGENYEDNPDTCWYNNSYSLALPGAEKATALAKLKLGAVVYIPKSALSTEGAAIDIGTYLDVLQDSEGTYLGWLGGRYSVNVRNEGGSIVTGAWDEVKQKDAKASSFISYKEGTGKLKNYYIITVKNIPTTGTISGEADSSIKVKSSTKYPFNIGVSVTGTNTKTSGKLYIDNVVAKNGSKKVVSYDFSKKPSWFSAVYKEKEMSAKKALITTIK